MIWVVVKNESYQRLILSSSLPFCATLAQPVMVPGPAAGSAIAYIWFVFWNCLFPSLPAEALVPAWPQGVWGKHAPWRGTREMGWVWNSGEQLGPCYSPTCDVQSVKTWTYYVMVVQLLKHWLNSLQSWVSIACSHDLYRLFLEGA